jgi:hypothetical protein
MLPLAQLEFRAERATQMQPDGRLTIPTVIGTCEKVIEEALLQCHALLEIEPLFNGSFRFLDSCSSVSFSGPVTSSPSRGSVLPLAFLCCTNRPLIYRVGRDPIQLTFLPIQWRQSNRGHYELEEARLVDIP